MRRFAQALALVSLIAASRVDAWSPAGHKTVCQIAFLELDTHAPDVKEKVVEILSKETAASGFRSFPIACTWADNDKSTAGTIQNKRRDDHFVNLARDQATIAGESCPLASKCLFTAIADDSETLQSGTGVKQRQALKFLGHWMGDLHQPLHVSFKDDRGGNWIDVSGINCIELHGTWDNCIPSRLLKQAGTNSYINLGTKLQADITAEERASWQTGSLADWAAESFSIAREPDVQYCEIESGSCCYPDKSSCQLQGSHTALVLDEQYLDAHVQQVRKQMQKAGVRPEIKRDPSF